jgi:hypothetical protein
MKNLLKTCFLSFAFLGINYASTFAQDEQKAFKEGDKVFTFGLGFGSETPLSSITRHSPMNFSKGNETIGFTPSIAFDYGLKGTRGLVSIGGFLSYSQRVAPIDGGYGFNIYNASPYNVGQNDDYTITKLEGLKSHTLTAGLRFGLHYSTRKLDFYAGTMIGFQKVITESKAGELTYYQGNPNNGSSLPAGVKKLTYLDYSLEEFIIKPYVGVRYYVSPKIGLNIEAEQLKGRVGLSFKF